jgi:hypothetical protein
MASLGEKVVFLVRTQMRKKVERGEGWDLARWALRRARAKTPPDDFGGERYVWGDPVALMDARPGDILQFDGAAWQCDAQGWAYKGSIPRHTAVVEEVDGVNFTLLHQNFDAKKVVRRDRIPIAGDGLLSGTITAYRPARRH